MPNQPELDITPEQRQEIDALFANEKLIKYMGAGIANKGESTDIKTILARQDRAIEVLSKKDESFWSFE